MRQGFARIFSVVLALSTVPFVSPNSVLGEGPNWVQVEDDDGIKVWSLAIPGKDLPGFRGITAINASIEDILKEMVDIPAQTDWMYRCREARMLKQYSESHGILYNRTRAPWPLKDRDVVVDVDYRYTPQRNALSIRIKNTDEIDVPVPFWTVRMPKLNGFYRLWTETPGKTNVLYQIEVDIGGNVPDFAARRNARKLAFITLQRLRERVEAKHR